jgi:pyruvate dehydrogenase E2 component (dihydrolipoamide acetyltransferase)
MTEAKLLQWNVEVGDLVNAGDTIAEVEADKANMEIEAQEDGIVTALYGTPGDMIPVGRMMAEISATPSASSRPATASKTADSSSTISPLVQRLATQRGIDLSKVKGSGPGGRIEVADLEAGDHSQPDAAR